MNSILQYLRPEGTDYYEVAMYCFFRAAPDAERVESHLSGLSLPGTFDSVFVPGDIEGEPPSLTSYFRIQSESTVGPTILRLMTAGARLADIVIVLCILEGSYGGFHHTFEDDQWLPHGVYGFCLAGDHPVLTLSEKILGSEAWRSLIASELPGLLPDGYIAKTGQEGD